MGKIYKLPSVTSLKKYTKKIKINPGFNSQIFHPIKLRVNAMEKEDRKCILMMDEVSLKQNLQFKKTDDKLHELTDFGGDSRGKEKSIWL